MPCDGSYLNPTDNERNSNEVCKHIIYLLGCIETEAGKKCKLPQAFTDASNLDGATYQRIKAAARNPYGNIRELDEHVAILCSILSNMPEKLLDKYVYNGRVEKARALADWWEKHQKADKARTNAAKKKAAQKVLAKKVIDKLTTDEVAALKAYFTE